MKRIYDNKALSHAKELRQNLTDAENVLWFNIRNRRLCNIKFRRQVPIGKYIVDFLCVEKKLIIELDGSQHLDNARYDTERTNYLESIGYSVLRFFNDDVLRKTTDVLQEIYSEYERL